MAASWCRRSYLFKTFGVKTHISRTCFHRHALRSQNRILSSFSFSSSSTVTKKDVSHPMEKTHDPTLVEDGWYDWWMSQGFFAPNDKAHLVDEDKFVVVLPPPNVTGTLHLGHTLTCAVQDALVRWHRMKGNTVLWIPGMDHAGIATQVVVEKRLWRQQRKTRHDLGKHKFVQEIWDYKEMNAKDIVEQTKRLGCSLDWSREYFTLDERMSRAVTEAFCRLYEKGLVYRAERLVNWSCALRSSVSDIEVDNVRLEGPTILSVPGEPDGVEFGTIASFAYPLADSDEKIVVSTTRLETMLGDTAVAVHPDDPRYGHLVGRHVAHPLDGGRLIPIIADSFVDREFGHGAVKITPGHDRIDFDVGLRHGLGIMDILNDDGSIKEEAPLVGGLGRFQARRKLREALCLLGLYHGEKEHPTVIPVCSRSGDIIEPRLKTQWFLNCKEMAQRALKVVEEGHLQLIPDYNKKVWSEWLSDTQDWCLSRQLWWGHQIPIYQCQASGRQVCARTEGEAREQLAHSLQVSLDEVNVKQDPDVLDTWFSSGVLPFSTLGWPDKTPDLDKFFPTSLLETGHDILFFWVARMCMLSLELTGTCPFHTVLLHGLIRDAQGRKMSKSLGNVINPLDVIQGISLEDLHKSLESGNLDPREVETAKAGQKFDFPNGIAKCGADALRLTLCSYNTKHADISFNVEHAESKRRFCNKIWQSFKFIFHHLGPDYKAPALFQLSGKESATDLWILSRLSHMVESCDQHFPSFDLHLVSAALQSFWYQEVCDVYLEAVKPVLSGSDKERQRCVQNVLFLCATTFVKSMSPFMPFLCEELYQRLSCRGEGFSQSVCTAQYPSPAQYPWHDQQTEASMKNVQEIIFHVQKLRKDYNIMASKSDLYVQTDDQLTATTVNQHRDCLLALSRSGRVSVLHSSESGPPGCTSTAINPHTSVFVMLKGSVDVNKELSRLQKRREQLDKGKEKLQLKLDKLMRKGRHKWAQAEILKIEEKMEKIKAEQMQISEMEQALNKTEGQS